MDNTTARRSRMAAAFKWLLVITLLAVSGCDEEDVGSLRMTLNADGSGTITAVRLVDSDDQAMGSDSGVTGISWDAAASVVTTSGSFTDLNQVSFGEVQFVAQLGGAVNLLKVTLPRGPQVSWPRLLTTTSEPARARVGVALASSATGDGSATKLGQTVKLEIALPVVPVSHGIDGNADLAKEEVNDKVASLVVPTAVILESGDPIVWHLTW